ncbi:solute carrier family 12 member 8 isoform X1 [Carcharodon carcharias]|uniref:solute carrier family 12 member 8 isoform X1 n=1 Tax=Carcharodon carcharias TaxID=13397 RepID=UPI001B7E7E25|nr:solute carrier family 12 member 8 isoform X1 [Carcharodon carcharias]XP_041057590.1 solute carrier family 12 member 8 isoform X1 [Carcharodon carcharias]XP_041057591.1 solute carrier family 12 member 8 isoform X1 [Carcharodon carcharias]XP_041057592.1 solute carrier family 12 member 8 isoform X1 [Carcharodon carcharias]XP_041057593.1 solute carrier family 12 member 8 isoform X1 [Carcharodon carcharias]XP_041057594.1 solute carrier family 12 member 8 isoform X1 [Carcharodon carcharias]XP_04
MEEDWDLKCNSEVTNKAVLLLNGSCGSRSTGQVQELFHEAAQVSQSHAKPWWKVKIFVWEPVLFGTWDGVFTTCMINIFGVVLFLRTGWLVGNTGVLLGMFMVTLVVLVALVTVLSGIGVWERCSLGNGGVYSMLSTVLGGRVGGTFGFLYVFGQCVAGAMFITGFAESIADLLNLSNIWAVRGISLAVLLGLLGINLAGVKWIIRFQLLLLALLAISTMDFVIGTFAHLDPDFGFVGYTEEQLGNNTFPDYSPEENFFTVFGVFFPTATGVMAGFNMSGDLQKPASNIPLGSLAAVGVSWFLYLVFVFLLGAVCTREALRYDFMIAEKVALVGFLWLLGLYISSLASCMGGLYGAPRILQCIAQERVVPALACLGSGKGPNKTPVAAICLVGLVTLAFTLIGQVNVLAPIVSINFMLTYSVVDYSYFSVCMSYDIQQKGKNRNKENARTYKSSQRLNLDGPLKNGTGGPIKCSMNGSLLEFNKDMNQIFQTVPHDREEEVQKNWKNEKNVNRSVQLKKVRKPAKQTLQDSFMLNLDNSNRTIKEDHSQVSGTEPVGELSEQDIGDHQHLENYFVPQSVEAHDNADYKIIEPTEHCYTDTDDSTEARGYGSIERQKSQEAEIYTMPRSFYSRLCNRWLSFIGALVSIVIMFVIHWIYALINIAVAFFIYTYIGQMSPGLPLGLANNFNFFSWIQTVFSEARRKGSPHKKQIIVTPSFTTVGMATTQLTEENADFASRDRYHHSSVISGEVLNRHLS